MQPTTYSHAQRVSQFPKYCGALFTSLLPGCHLALTTSLHHRQPAFARNRWVVPSFQYFAYFCSHFCILSQSYIFNIMSWDTKGSKLSNKLPIRHLCMFLWEGQWCSCSVQVQWFYFLFKVYAGHLQVGKFPASLRKEGANYCCAYTRPAMRPHPKTDIILISFIEVALVNKHVASFHGWLGTKLRGTDSRQNENNPDCRCAPSATLC